ncbi:MAG: hypothetical protein KDJ26_07170 [Alphaproteobacteria bacterium]|nr:hypothetical protein [Alphaproteobacteria bacterium]MCB9984301.1 hypothetical protein [Micavibrio sp.]HPQ50893.1 hypothetical protein [Alphaproteobacteria bacterium]
MATAKPKRSSWSQEARDAARARALSYKPWTSSTGPRTDQGKIISSRNSYKHGHYSREMNDIRGLLRVMAMRLAVVKTLHKGQKACTKRKSRNELSSRIIRQIFYFYIFFNYNSLEWLLGVLLWVH